MAIMTEEMVPFSQLGTRLDQLAEEAHAGSEKIITKDGERYIAIIDVGRLEHYRRLEREHVHLSLLDEATAGWEDVEAGRTMSVADLRARYGR